jgi:H+/Na+-translocating ferredoxin:NAD+ oxidoreductase subunit B
MLTQVTLIMSAAVLGGLALVMAYILGWANKAFYVEVDPKVEQVTNSLPGANCGGCGYVGCSEYAEAVAAGETEITLCAPGGASTSQALGEIMGMEVDQKFPYRPVLHCSANEKQRLQKRTYYGEQTCAAANLVGGIQGCVYGCLGFGDCFNACDYNAIEMVRGLPRINYDNCIGCKACVKSCPRNIFTMVPFKSEVVLVIGCSNKESGKVVRLVCETGCIGCGACAKKAPDLITMKGSLPVIDYDIWDSGEVDIQPALDKCPRTAGLIFIGKPTEEDKEAVKDEETPKVADSEFKTTVDDTEWRG